MARGKTVKKKTVRKLFNERKHGITNKKDFGYVALIGGCLKYSGAIRLAAMANAAVRSGSGVVTVAAPKEICPLIAPQILEATLLPFSKSGLIEDSEGSFMQVSSALKNYDAVCFGMGIGKEAEVKTMLIDLLENYEGILIVDADGLNVLCETELSRIRNSKAHIVLTPHYGEYRKLVGAFSSDENNPVSLVEKLSKDVPEKKASRILLLKGPNPQRKETLITDGRKTYLSERGCSGMSCGGSGDVLCGILSAMAGQFGKDRLLKAIACGAYINGLAGELAEKQNGDISMTASDTAADVTMAIRKIMK